MEVIILLTPLFHDLQQVIQKPYTILHLSGTYIIRRISGQMEIHQDINSVSLSAYHLNRSLKVKGNHNNISLYRK